MLALSSPATRALISYLLTYLLTPCSMVLLEKLTGLQLIKNFPSFYGTRKFITAFTSSRHLSLSCASSIQSTPPHPTCWRSILILSSHLCLVSLQWSLSLRFLHQHPVYASSLPHPSYMSSLSHSPRFYHPHNSGWAVQIMDLLLIPKETFLMNLVLDQFVEVKLHHLFKRKQKV
jgi:hypothetical protein